MLKPNKRHYYTEDDTSLLYFVGSPSDGLSPKTGKYYMRGGVCWPMMEQLHAEKEIKGFVVLCGLEIDSGRIWVFEQKEFVTIDNIVDPNTGNIEYEGISSCFNKAWSKYFAEKFYWFQHEEIARSYLLDVLRSNMIEPKPMFVEVPWSDRDQASISVWRRIKSRQLLFEKDSPVHREIQTISKNDKNIRPAFHALQCAVTGIDRYPYRKRRVA